MRTEATRVLLAVTDDRLAAQVHRSAAMVVVRECGDAWELVVAAGAGHGAVAVVDAGLAGLDRTMLSALDDLGVRVIGAARGAEQERLRALGIDLVVAAEGPGVVELAVQEAARPRRVEPAVPMWREISPAALDWLFRPPPEGGVVAVWGPAGAPGRSTVAAALGGALAGRGLDTLLVDADPYGGALADRCALADEPPGLLRVVRRADRGGLDISGIDAEATTIAPGLQVLTGLPHPARWSELRPAALDHVLRTASAAGRQVVVDCGFCLEDDEELSYDTIAPRRNAATLTALECADEVVAVGAADGLGLRRLLQGLHELDTLGIPGHRRVVLNRVREGVRRPGPGGGLRETLARHAPGVEVHLVPEDLPALDAATLAGRPVTISHPDSRVARALDDVAAGVVAAAGRV